MVSRLGKAVAVLIAIGFVGLGFSMGMTADQPDIQITNYEQTEEGLQVEITNQNPGEPVEVKISLIDWPNDSEITSETITIQDGEATTTLAFDGELDPDQHALTLEIDNREVQRDRIG
ncbi:hypothetical protein AMET1_0316 [Methanonatronarchaeum thermophilum]|uniref:Uncharacterized protein n=1 Tax=Methanonatronarchaeum thermophilum TaxID=1927129 RepID=A0A1Y3GB81_9EURY|nr:hypothetical protein [Methanonatronarchaeum thermophilum]OUJ18669.1 hypothetical protein AMET1_0316 [Methanonatronarchaeum thermophilum]